LLERLSREHDLNQGQSHSDDSNGVVELKSSANSANVSDELQQLPKIIMDEFIKYTTNDGAQEPQLLPIQRKSFEHIANGGDTVLFSPTGTGKTLAYILPLAARLLEWKRDGSLASKKSRKRTPGNKNDSVSEQVEPATPSILVMEPSRELARQVGKVWTRFHPTAAKNSKKHVVTVYGGVPMARHAAQLNSKTDVVVGTPGRIKELIREKYLSTENLKSIVLDEADTLLNFKDVPEVEWLLHGMQNDYQLVLASATINERVHIFVDEIMEISVGEEGYIVSNGVNEDKEQSHFTELDSIESEVSDDEQRAIVSQPEVRHWSMAASASSRVALTADLILTMEPRRGIIFAASKAEVEVVAGQLSERLSADHSIHVLHGDMIQQARSRAVAAFKGEQTPDSPSSRMTRILVATDVASRGLDVPSCDLVLQFGVPRQSGKDGTFDSELYIHRSGKKAA
jgi:superfamily II DNA/RNA helicase